MDAFTGTICGEGSKGYPILIIPAALKFPPGWARARIGAAAPCFAYVRKAGRFSLPIWNFPHVELGTKVEVRIEPAEPYRARAHRAESFDWNVFVENDERTFATDERGGVLKLWSRYSAPFELLRCPPVETVYRVLGFYQAEGSKSDGGGAFSFANTNVELLRDVLENLDKIGIGHDQLAAEILQRVGETRESAVATYASLPLEVTAVRPRSGKGGSAYVVHALNAKPFRGMVCRALAAIFANEFPSRETARAFAFGWLDGDGLITLTSTDAKLRLAGLPEEHAVVKRALTQVFGWDLSSQSTRYKDNKRGFEIGLRAERILNLLDADAFPFSMNRVRLLLGFDRRARGLAAGQRWGAYARWGLVDEAGLPTECGQRVVIAHRRYLPEIAKARQLQAAEPWRFGVKGAPLPPQFRLGIPE